MEDLKAKILLGRASEKERLLFYRHLNADAKEEKAFIELKNMLAIHRVSNRKSFPLDKKRRLNAIWEKIENKQSTGIWTKIAAIAAIVMLTLAGSYLLNVLININTLESNRIVTITTSPKSINQFELADGTKVTLNANSQIRILSEESDEVVLGLKGQAYFDVIHNEYRKFVVKAGGVDIVDRGTAFSVKADDNQVVATLFEGNIDVVSVSKEIHSLEPGEQFILDQEGVRIISHEQSEPSSTWMTGKFIFRKIKLFEIADEIEQWYGVEVHFENMDAGNYNFSGTIDRSITLEELMRLLSYSTSVKYEIINNSKGNKIVLIK
ncbi:FecR family protein [Carboxylicivirga marina]|uniref:FecR family protein n=1 Tax=Carboxylicivirga marina TaxID=2800988 RepID=A0ABS1HPQ1_9BACT|nr:FecR family protein [Carboxylicivirga marina]MBK3519662.1 FecR family protein [Carboxylicivirga marina]